MYNIGISLVMLKNLNFIFAFNIDKNVKLSVYYDNCVYDLHTSSIATAEECLKKEIKKMF